MKNFSPSKSLTHSIKDHNFTLMLKGAPIVIDSMGDDSEAYNYERNKAETFELVSDCSGDGHYSFDPDKSGKITLKLYHTNPNNKKMQALRGVVTPVGEIINPAIFDVVITDGSGNTLVRGNKCRIQGQPSAGRGKAVGTVEWTILCVELLVNETGVEADV